MVQFADSHLVCREAATQQSGSSKCKVPYDSIFKREAYASVKRFVREAVLWSKLERHPNILHCIGFHLDDIRGQVSPCLVSELCEGSIQEFIIANSSADLERISFVRPVKFCGAK